jgi:hypothetical protein
MTNFPLLNPDLFFFDVSGPAQKAVLVPFFWGGFYGLFSPNYFLISGGFQQGHCRSQKF